MITGDNKKTANSIAGSLSIDTVFAEIMPAGKVNTLKELQHSDGLLGFVGDGINDAPALAQADIGFAMGSGTDIAIESADVVLMNSDLGAVVNGVRLAKSTMRNIYENLFWAFAYNVALIPLAAGAFYPALGISLSPMFAAGAMAMSSVFVLLNALRLKRFQLVKVRSEG
jgi:P-type E1-E2 ATPase